MATTYADYLELESLLSLQRPRSDGPEHDEMLFIIVHQVYELWFKELLHEFDFLDTRLRANDTPPALHTLKRILTILKVLVVQLDILETMTPLEFLSFRDRLAAGSGLHSSQFREIEFVLGFKGREAIERFPVGSPMRAQLERRYTEPTLWSSFLEFLALNGYQTPDGVRSIEITQPTESREVQDRLLEIYRSSPAMTELCERLVDLDEGVQEWRYRHVKMVQRTIGTRTGTGGSSGAEYLMKTLFKPAFPDLWAIRTEL